MTGTAVAPSVDCEAQPGVSRNRIWRTIQVLLQVVFTFWLRYRARGIENLPKTGGALLLANHQSFLDPLLIGLPLRRPVSFLARQTLFRIPFIGWVLRNTYVVPFDRDGGGTAGLREILRRVELGFLVGVFPEGTRSADGTVGPFKPGFITLVRRSQQPIYPVGIAGAHRAMGRGRGLWLRPARVCVVFGEPLLPDEIARLAGRGHEEELLTLVRDRIVACQAEAEAWLRRE